MGPTNQIKDILSELAVRLAEVSDTPRLDAQVLISNVKERSRTWVLAHPEASLSTEEQNQLEKLASRLKDGEPLPYVLGHWEFFGLDLMVTPDTLIPRPETELLVEFALDWLERNPARRWAADVGTGSGCITIALCIHVPDLRIISSDISYAALRVAKRNAYRHNVEEQFDLLQADGLPAVHQPFDLICANLPYIPTQTLKKLKIYRQEPTVALDGGAEGLDLIQRILKQSKGRLTQGGLLLMEIEASQGRAALSLARNTFETGSVEIKSDLSGKDRLIIIENHA